MQLSNRTKITKVSDAVAAGTSTINSASIDMTGWDGVLFLVSFGTAAADNILNAQQSSDDAVADAFANLADTAVAVAASDEDQWLDLYRPQERYVRATAVRGTSSTIENIWAIQYAGGRKQPADNATAGTIAGEAHVSPAEGTI